MRNKKREYKRIIDLDFSGARGLFLFGPRQTGKSYWLRKKFPQSAIMISFCLMCFSGCPKSRIFCAKSCWLKSPDSL